MTVTLTVTETSCLDAFPLVEVFEGKEKYDVILGYLNQSTDMRFSRDALYSLLTLHNDLRLGGPTWDIRFQLTYDVG